MIFAAASLISSIASLRTLFSMMNLLPETHTWPAFGILDCTAAATGHLAAEGRGDAPDRGTPRWQTARGVSHEHAVLHEVLAECLRPCAETRELLAAREAAEFERDESAKGRWLAELARRLLG